MERFKLHIEAESRIRWKVYVRFGGEFSETDHSNMARRWLLSLRIYRHVFVADVTDGEGIGPVFQLQCIVTIQIGDGALCRSAHLHGGSRQRFFGLSVGDCPFDGSRRGSHDGKCEE